MPELKSQNLRILEKMGKN